MDYSGYTEKLTLDLVTYGSPAFDRKKFLPVENNLKDPLGSKPQTGGLWASPVDSDYGWVDWCLDNSFELEDLEESFEFRFVGRVVTINCSGDLLKLPWKKSPLFDDMPESINYFGNFIPYDLLAGGKGGIDAIYLTPKGLGTATNMFGSSQGRHLYGWDCECVLVINPDCCKLAQC